MSRYVRLLGVVLLTFLALSALALALGATRPASASTSASVVAQACELPPPTDGSANPTTVMPGQVITFTVWNFRAGEEASYWFTTPRGIVFGTANPLCCVEGDGYIRFEPLPIPQEFGTLPGRWALTVQGRDSQHTSIVYFCISNTAVQPTATAAPPTSTPAPPTATTAAATATSVPPTGTTIPAPPTPEGTVPAPTVAATAEVTVQPTSPPAPTAEATIPPVPEATAMPMPTPEGPGMPRTGEPVPIFYLTAAMMSVILLAAGVATLRRGSRVTK